MTSTAHLDMRTITAPSDSHGDPCRWCDDTIRPVTANVIVRDPEGNTQHRATCSDETCIVRAAMFDHHGDDDPIVEVSTYRDTTELGEALAVILPAMTIEPARMSYAAQYLPPVLRLCAVRLVDVAYRQRRACVRCGGVAQLLADGAGLCGFCAPDAITALFPTTPLVTVEVYQ